jgi:hypothetical protein
MRIRHSDESFLYIVSHSEHKIVVGLNLSFQSGVPVFKPMISYTTHNHRLGGLMIHT